MHFVKTLFLAAIAVICASTTAIACPFCSAVSQTFSEEMSIMDVVAIAELQTIGKVNNINTSDAQAEVPKSTFVIKQVIKGEEFIKAGDTFDTIYFGEAKLNRPFLAMATDAPKLTWSTPLILTERAQSYLGKLKGLSEGHERLAFFQDYLEDEDEMLARDAYDEFAKAPYADVIALKPKMQREKLISFIRNPDVPSNRRRLYFTMLGVCGTAHDAKLLESFMTSDDRKSKAGLDSMLACYMILSGEKGLDKVDELFLGNKEAEYADTYAAIMAIRFHGSETDVIPRKRLVKSLRLMLERPELADLVIPDLARWEDWEILPKLVDLFVSADENSSWVRVPVINYLRACPLPHAAEKIEELKKVDAESVKRAMTFFPFKEEKKGEDAASKEATDKTTQSTIEGSTAAERKPKLTQLSLPHGGEPVAQASVDTITTPDEIRAQKTESLTSIQTPETLNEIEAIAVESETDMRVVLGAAFLGGSLCFVAMRSILGINIHS